MRIITLFFLVASSVVMEAKVIYVGTQHDYKTPNELYIASQRNSSLISDGDTIYIEGQTYRGRATLSIWRDNNLYISGVNGTPKLYADGTYIAGKGIWVAAGNNIHINNISFHEATVPDKNGAGIRLDGSGLLVTNCYFFDNENGILTNGEPLVVIDKD